MERLSNNKETVIIDVDVLVNWLCKEVETITGKELWQAPHRIISFVENDKIDGILCLTTLLELRYLLRRKKSLSELRIRSFIDDIVKDFNIGLPDEATLLRANELQTIYPLDPFDAILLAFALSKQPSTLISRDTFFIKVASRYLKALTPEEFVKSVR